MCVKNNTVEWVDEETFEAIRVRDKKYQRFKKTRLHTDHINFKQSRNKVKNFIKSKQRNYTKVKLQRTLENIKKVKTTNKK